METASNDTLIFIAFLAIMLIILFSRMSWRGNKSERPRTYRPYQQSPPFHGRPPYDPSLPSTVSFVPTTPSDTVDDPFVPPIAQNPALWPTVPSGPTGPIDVPAPTVPTGPQGTN